MRRHSQKRDGFALLATLWLCLAITAVSLGFALDARRDRLAVTNSAEHTQALAAARAGIATATAHLDRLIAGTAPVGSMPFDPNDPWRWADSVVSEHSTLSTGASYAVRAISVGARLDVNVASEQDWRNLLIALEVDMDRADRIAQSIADWRDPDGDPRVNGAEESQYQKAGMLAGPTNHNFGSIDDLRDVMGITPEIFDRVQPFLTIRTPMSRTQVNVNTAPIPVLRIIPELTDNAVAVILARRSSGARISSLAELAQLAGGRIRANNTRLQQQLLFSTQQVCLESAGSSPGGRTRTMSLACLTRNGPNATDLAQSNYDE